MPDDHQHGHDHHGHGHDHAGHDHHGHHHHHGPPRPGFSRRLAIAVAFVALAALAAAAVPVRAGSVQVVTRFGEPMRVLITPGLAWKWPAPVERAVEVDCRMQTTLSGNRGVLTRDGLSVVLQAHVEWRVPAEPEAAVRFLRAVRGEPAGAANHLRTLLGSALETVSGRFDLAALVNADPALVRRGEFESALAQRLRAQAGQSLGLEILHVGLARLMLPDSTISATTTRMAAERETIAEEKKSAGRKLAGEIRSGADREARLVKAQAEEEASAMAAAAASEAAAIYAKAQRGDPELYAFLRSLDTLGELINPGTRLILRSDAAPFRALIDGPALAAPAPDGASPAPKPTPTPAPQAKP